MKHLFFLLLIIGTAFTTACSTDGDTKMSEDSAAEAKEEMTEAKEEVKAEAKEEMEEAKEEMTEAKEEAAAETNDMAPASAGGSSSDVTYTCTHDGSIRTIRVLYHEAGSPVCEVTYEKAEGTQTLWSANNDDSYCAPKAEAFVEKQEGWGWSCSK